MSDQRGSPVGWALWLRWMLASTVGVVVIFALLGAVAMAVRAIVGGGAEDKVPFVPFLGLAFGAAQWFVLRGYVPRAGWWVLATAAGWLAGLGLLAVAVKAWEGFFGQANEYETLALLFFAAAGAAMGALQWLVLRQRTPQAGWWIAASFAAWLVLGPIVGKSLDRFTDLIAIAVVPAAVTGGMLVWLLRQALSAISHPGQSAA